MKCWVPKGSGRVWIEPVSSEGFQKGPASTVEFSNVPEGTMEIIRYSMDLGYIEKYYCIYLFSFSVV